MFKINNLDESAWDAIIGTFQIYKLKSKEPLNQPTVVLIAWYQKNEYTTNLITVLI